VFPSVLTVRREAMDRVGCFDESLHGLEYYDLVLRLASLVSFGFVSGPVAKNGLSKVESWGTRFERRLHETELSYILNRALSLMPEGNDAPAMRRRVLGAWFAEIAHGLDRPETFVLLRQHILRSINENPWMLEDPVSRDVMMTCGARVLSDTLQR